MKGNDIDVTVVEELSFTLRFLFFCTSANTLSLGVMTLSIKLDVVKREFESSFFMA